MPRQAAAGAQGVKQGTPFQIFPGSGFKSNLAESS